MATPTEMTQGQPRNELKRRGLICGVVKDLRLCFLEDDAFGVIGGNLATLSDEKLKKICESRAIPSQGDRQELVHKVQAYHRQKRAEQSSEDENITDPTRPDLLLSDILKTGTFYKMRSRVYDAAWTRSHLAMTSTEKFRPSL